MASRGTDLKLPYKVKHLAYVIVTYSVIDDFDEAYPAKSIDKLLTKLMPVLVVAMKKV